MTETQPLDELIFVTLDQIEAAADNLRQKVEDIDDLEDSIVTQGVLQPLTLTTNGADKYKIVAGHRRSAAIANAVGKGRLAPDFRIPALLRKGMEDAARIEAMVVENIQRQDLNPVEEALGYQRLIDLGLSQDDIAGRVGRNQSTVSKRLKLLTLHDRLQAAVAKGTLAVETGQVLAGIKDQDVALYLWEVHGDRLNKDSYLVDNAIRNEKAVEAARKLYDQAVKANLPVIEAGELTSVYRWNSESFAKVAEAKAHCADWEAGDDSRYLVVRTHGDGKSYLDVYQLQGKSADRPDPNDASRRQARLERITKKLETEALAVIVEKPAKAKVMETLAAAFLEREVMTSTAKPIAELLGLEPLLRDEVQYGTGEIRSVKDWVGTVQAWAEQGDRQALQALTATLFVHYAYTKAVHDFLVAQGFDREAIRQAAQEQV